MAYPVPQLQAQKQPCYLSRVLKPTNLPLSCMPSLLVQSLSPKDIARKSEMKVYPAISTRGLKLDLYTYQINAQFSPVHDDGMLHLQYLSSHAPH